jgi:hypothetical protein
MNDCARLCRVGPSIGKKVLEWMPASRFPGDGGQLHNQTTQE